VEKTLRIEKLVHGGDGLARDGGEVLFVPLVAAGDLVRVAIEGTGASRRVKLLELLEAGPERVPPPCPHVGSCGGCDRQQVAPAGQLAAKADAVREALERIGRLDASVVSPIVPSPLPERYRRRLRAQIVKEGWGFSMRASHKAVRVESCLLAEEALEQMAGRLAPELKASGLGAMESFGLDVTNGQGAAHLVLKEEPTHLVQAKASRLLRHVPGLMGLVLTGPAGKPVTVGDPVLIDAEHWRLRIRPDLFAQANRLGARAMAEAVAATASPGAKVLELFAGAGTLTLPLAHRAGALTATEGEGPALTLLKAALEENGKTARLIGGPAKRVVDGLASEGVRFDHVVMDPPRVGAKEAIDGLVRLGAPRITYVSCDPATFARDARRLVDAGWRLEVVTPYDLFPHTHHVELVAVLER
jgi:23S rRNA (uracil1939-C5)-methyltransferase